MQPAGGGRVVLRKGRDRRLKAGHLWVYAGEIQKTDDGLSPGDAVEVVDHRGRFLARGYYNPASSITVRLLTRSRDEVRFLVLLRAGQKTGLYLDHRFNRRALQPHARGRRVLDVFCNTGSFGLYALKAGAERCTGIEISAECLDLARRNAALNGFEDRCEWIEGNAFDHLRALDHGKERFDLIVLDPPAFTKSARATAAAVRGYKEINLRALRLAAPGAIIATSSCSYHLGPEEFLEVVRDAAADPGRDATLVEMRGQAPDHPIHLSVPETRYLKFALLLVRN